MRIKENKLSQLHELNKICDDNGVDFDSLKALLDSLKTKKLLSKKNYHQQSIDDTINNAIK
jgi:hypothetical protein